MVDAYAQCLRYNELVLNVAPLLTKKKHSDKDHMAKSPASGLIY